MYIICRYRGTALDYRTFFATFLLLFCLFVFVSLFYTAFIYILLFLFFSYKNYSDTAVFVFFKVSSRTRKHYFLSFRGLICIIEFLYFYRL